MSTSWKTVRVFISSTFRDMQAERDHLVRFVFPRLREELLSSRIHLVDVDLRWGVTSEQDASEVCREIIDECRPRFLCMLGGRYGWVPTGRNRSITADEVHYGVLDQTLNDRGFAYFYFRDEAATATMVEPTPGELREPQDSENQNKLAELKQAIIAANLNPCAYPAQWDNESRRLTGLTRFGDQVYDDLLASMKSDLELQDRFETDTVAQLDEFAEENAAMEAFVEEHSERFVLGSRETVLEELLAHANATGGNGYVCLIGVPGSGKSALLAHFYRALSAPLASSQSAIHNPQSEIVIPHFVGASPGSTDVRRTLRRLCHELKAGCPDITADIPDDPEKLRVAFPDFLRQACARRRVVILLDAVNQFDPAFYSAGLHWLPEELPANACVILSALDGPALEELRRRHHKPREIELKPLTADDGEAIIEQFRKRYRKQFEPDQRAALLAKTDADTPLYLLAALEELRTLGAYEEITRRIAELPPTTHALFAWILERLENDDGFRDALGQRVGCELVSRFAALLGASRYGLSQRELADLLDAGDPQGNVAALLHLLRPYLMRRGELLDFYHGQFRAAAEEAWLKTDAQRRAANAQLANYFRSRSDPSSEGRWESNEPRAMGETAYHAVNAADVATVRQLIEKEFLEHESELLGDVTAMLDAHAMAELLAREGKDYFVTLVRCAHIYCDMNDRVRNRPAALETFAVRGDCRRIEALVEAQPEGINRRKAWLAAALLLRAHGHSGQSILMSRRAENAEVNDWVSLLARAILTEEPTADVKPLFDEPSPLRTGTPRACAASPFQLLALHIRDRYILIPWFLGAFFTVPIMAIVLWGMVTRTTDLDNLFGQVGGPSCFVSLAVAVGLFCGIPSWRRSLPARFDALERVSLESGANRQPAIQWRALYMCNLATKTDADMRDWWSPSISRIAARLLQCSTDASARARVIILTNGVLRDQCATSQADVLTSLPLEEVQSVFECLRLDLNSWQRGEPILKLCASQVGRASSEALVFAAWGKIVESAHYPNSLPRQAIEIVVRHLPAEFARGLLRSLGTKSKGTMLDGTMLDVVVGGYRWLGKRARVAARIIRQPISFWEPVVVFGFLAVGLAPMLMFVYLLVGTGLFMFAVPMAVFYWIPLAFTYFYDFYRLREVHALGTREERVHMMTERLASKPQYWTMPHLWWERQWALRSVLSERLLSGDVGALRERAGIERRTLSRILSDLVRRGIVATQGSLILATMSDRYLLQAAVSVPFPEGHRQRIVVTDPLLRDSQLLCHCPLTPWWIDWALSALMGFVAALVFLTGLSVFRFGSPELYSVMNQRTGVVAALAALLPFSYHLFRPTVSTTVKYTMINRWIFVVALLLLLASGYMDALEEWALHVVAAQLLIACHIVPTFRSLWRGAHLLYPDAGKRWRHRVGSVVLFAGTSFLLSAAAATVGPVEIHLAHSAAVAAIVATALVSFLALAPELFEH